jgi:hypothetical protein
VRLLASDFEAFCIRSVKMTDEKPDSDVEEVADATPDPPAASGAPAPDVVQEIDKGRVMICIRNADGSIPDLPPEQRADFVAWWNVNSKHWFAPKRAVQAGNGSRLSMRALVDALGVGEDE